MLNEIHNCIDLTPDPHIDSGEITLGEKIRPHTRNHRIL
jgi:hypothetical protein